MLAAHYGQIRRKHEVATYEWVKSELDRTNHSIANASCGRESLLNETELRKRDGSNAVEDYFANGWYAGQTRLEEEYELNQTMQNNSFDPVRGAWRTS